MDLARMLERCEREQWSLSDLHTEGPPRAMSREEEESIVQYFTDMAGIERLAAALFDEQRRKVTDPVLARIFETFVLDELRHAHVAERLAAHYDVHRYRRYRVNPHLSRFTPRFVAAIRHLTPEVGNAYITAGEMILDVALLRSLDDFVSDEASHEAMRLINRDESRHIAIDFHMCEEYALAAERRRARPPAPGPATPRAVGERLRAYWTFVNVVAYGAPFFRDVFFEPMDHTDPSGRRLGEALDRLRQIARRPAVSRRPYVRWAGTVRNLLGAPGARAAAEGWLGRLTGLDGRVLDLLELDLEGGRTGPRAANDEPGAPTPTRRSVPV
jgi:hypothetical protein